MQTVNCDAHAVQTSHARTATWQLRAHMCECNLVYICMVFAAISVLAKCSPRLTQHC